MAYLGPYCGFCHQPLDISDRRRLVCRTPGCGRTEVLSPFPIRIPHRDDPQPAARATASGKPEGK